MLCSPEPMADARRAADSLREDPTGALLASELPVDATITVVGWPEQAASALRRRGDVEVLVVDSDGESDEVARQLDRLDVDAVAVATRNIAAAVEASELVLIDALAVGPSSVLAPAGSAAAAAVARSRGVPVWVVAGVGRLMPGSMFDAMVDRWSQGVDPLVAAEEVLPLDWADRIACVDGVLDVAAALTRTDCPVAPELFRLAG
jgi:translation initiation factor 2B subunit (eIF-2B alpha/beta/delta family)